MFPSGALLARSTGTQPSSRCLEMRKSENAEPRVGQDIWSCTTSAAQRPTDQHASDKEDKLGLFSRDIKTMDDLFLHTLRDIYYAEKKIVKSLPEMVEQATDAGLKRGFQEHLKQTENHVKRLEQVFEKLGEEPKGVDCPAIDGIIDEAEDVAGEVDDKSVLDAALIAAAQAVEHYEMTRYGTLIAWAKQLGRNDCVSLLQQTLDEEKETDKKLTAMAESGLNRRAA